MPHGTVDRIEKSRIPEKDMVKIRANLEMRKISENFPNIKLNVWIKDGRKVIYTRR